MNTRRSLEVLAILALVAAWGIGAHLERETPAACPPSLRAYNEYLTERFHEVSRPWFDQAGDNWAVLEYQIEADGRISGLRVNRSSGPLCRADRLLECVRSASPLRPPPRPLRATELWWNVDNSRLSPDPQALEQQLSTLYDGRWLR